MTQCPYLCDSQCQLASQLAGQSVFVVACQCDYCSTQAEPPRALNGVIASLVLSVTPRERFSAVRSQYGHLLNNDEQRTRLAAIESGDGVGSQLWRLLASLGVRHTETCACLALAEKMNGWGPAGCRLARAEIVRDMRTNAAAYGWQTVATAAAAALRTGLAWRLDLADVYGSLVDEAIRLASGVAPASR